MKKVFLNVKEFTWHLILLNLNTFILIHFDLYINFITFYFNVFEAFIFHKIHIFSLTIIIIIQKKKKKKKNVK